MCVHEYLCVCLCVCVHTCYIIYYALYNIISLFIMCVMYTCVRVRGYVVKTLPGPPSSSSSSCPSIGGRAMLARDVFQTIGTEHSIIAVCTACTQKSLTPLRTCSAASSNENNEKKKKNVTESNDESIINVRRAEPRAVRHDIQCIHTHTRHPVGTRTYRRVRVIIGASSSGHVLYCYNRYRGASITCTSRRTVNVCTVNYYH